MSLGLLVAIVMAGIVLVVYAVHCSGGSDGTVIDDTGAAIVAFGQAYPALPIRDVMMTADKNAAFLRLADGRVGFVQAIGKHYLTRLISPGSIEIGEGGDDRSLKLNFRETTFKGGIFRFATADEAAELSLWLVGSLLVLKNETDERRREDRRDA